jgi:2-isopropylmalate synthase
MPMKAPMRFELLAKPPLGEVPEVFDVELVPLAVERRFNALGEEDRHMAEAVVKVKSTAKRLMSVAEGNGPVNALDMALRKDLGKYQAAIADLELVDYKVRILNGGTGRSPAC